MNSKRLLLAALLFATPACAQDIQNPRQGANPSATIGASAVNGTAQTFMRSDAAPALPATLPAISGANLTSVNAATLGGATFAAPGAIGGGTPAASSFTQTTYPAFAGNAGAATSNVLVGYQEGTWTPVLVGWTNVGSPTLTGTYTRIGRLVCLFLRIIPGTTVAATVTTSSVTGIPYAASQPSAMSLADGSIGGGIGNGALISTSTIYPGSISATGDPVNFSGCYNA